MDIFTIRVKEKHDNINQTITQLETLLKIKNLDKDIVQAASERLVERVIEDSIKLSHIMLKEKGIINREKSFATLSDLQTIPKDIAIKLELTKGMRNMMIHQYDSFDEELFNNSIPDLIQTVKLFLKHTQNKTA